MFSKIVKLDMKRFLLLILILISVSSVKARNIEEIKTSGVLYVAFTQSSLNSINYKIAQEFANFLQVKLVPVITSWDENFSLNGKRPSDLETNPNYHYTPDALKKADLICGTIYVYPWRKKLFDYAGIMQVSDLLVVRKVTAESTNFIHRFIPDTLLDMVKRKDIRTLNDLRNTKIALLQNSSYQANMSVINANLDNSIDIIKTASEEESQNLLLKNQADGFVAVSSLALEFINKHSDIAKLAFPVGKPFDVGWAVEKGNKGLSREINNFFNTIKGNGKLNNIFRNYYGIDYQTYLAIINSYTENNINIKRSFDDILKSDKIIIGLRNREMIYSPEGAKQFSENLAEAFARYLNLQLEVKIIPDISTYFKAKDGKIYPDSSYTPEIFNNIDVACDILAPVPWRLSKVDIIGYMPNALVVVGRKNQKITNVADLKKLKGVTAKGSSYEAALQKNNITNYTYAPANDLLKLVDEGKADYTLVSITIYSLPKYQNLEAKFILGEITYAGWAINKNHPKLRQKVLEFFDFAKKWGLMDDYFKQQTGMPFRAAEKYLTALHQTYNIGVFPFVFYGSKQGIPQENIMSIYQDKKGYIWFGTFSGAVRYNGRRMELFNTNNGLIGNEVLDIKQDSNKIYFATLKGVSSFSNGVFDTILKNYAIKHIFIDSKNRKWFYGNNGIIVLDKNNSYKYINKTISKNIHNIHSIAEIPETEDYIIGTTNGIFLLNYKNNLIKKISNLPVLFIFRDKNNGIWISSERGVYHTDIYSLKNGQFGTPINKKLNINSSIKKIIQTPDEAIWLVGDFKVYQIFSLNLSPIVYNQTIGLSGQKITSFFVDNEGDIWFGHYGGVQKLSNRSLRLIYPNILKYDINNILQDTLNHIWIAFNNKIFVISDSLTDLTNKFSKENKSFVIEKLKNSGNLIVATNEGLYEVNPANFSIVNKNIFSEKLLSPKKMFIDSKGRIFISTGEGGIVYYFKNFYSSPIRLENTYTTLIQDFYQIDTTVIAANNTGLVYFDNNNFKEYLKSPKTITVIKKINDKIYVGTQNGLFYLENKKLIPINIKDLSNNAITAIATSNSPNHIWLGTYRGLNYVNLNTLKSEFEVNELDGLPGNEISTDGLMRDDKGLLWIATMHGVATYDIKKKAEQKYEPDCRIERILLNGKPVNTIPARLKHNQNSFLFELSGLSFKNEEAIVYDYYLRGENKIYLSSSGLPHQATYQNLPPGKYSFLYRAMGKDGIWSYYKKIDFEIEKPFWQTWWFFSALLAFFIFSVFIIIKLREKALKAKNEELERLVKQRTKEIEKQKADIESKNAELEQQQEEIIAQRDQITKQRDLAESQRDEIAKQQEEIMDSIYYAKRIQAAILPPEKFISTFLPEHFILYLPRDIVSGDFYWIKQHKGLIYVVAGDCTGHGVPGAFMSMLGSTLLDEIILRTETTLSSGQILDKLRQGVINALHQTGKVEEAKDGMDMALYIIDKQNKQIQFSGAFNPLFVIRGEELIEIKADRMPIGIFDKLDNFKTSIFKPQKNDLIYTFSDGYASQFGGPSGKKFKISRFSKLLLTIKDRTMEEQKILLNKALKNWMGIKYEQVDDILVIGVKYIWD